MGKAELLILGFVGPQGVSFYLPHLEPINCIQVELGPQDYPVAPSRYRQNSLKS